MTGVTDVEIELCDLRPRGNFSGTGGGKSEETTTKLRVLSQES